MKKFLGTLLFFSLCGESCAAAVEPTSSFVNSNSDTNIILIKPLIPFSLKIKNNSRNAAEAKIDFVDRDGNRVDGFSHMPEMSLAPGETKSEELYWYGNEESDNNPGRAQKFFVKIKYSDGRIVKIQLQYREQDATSSGEMPSENKDSKYLLLR